MFLLLLCDVVQSRDDPLCPADIVTPLEAFQKNDNLIGVITETYEILPPPQQDP